ncbi:LPS export ABC transporter periplasmic protein LptC [Oxalobacteraceae bacterium]|nr:LPS export ABC transporter periplasmic protein LptC [Oxalobacteraceae bacterium]
MRKINAHRWRLTLTLLVFVFLAFATFWLVEVMNQTGQELQADSHRNEPDYIIDRFSFVRMNAAGRPSYIISGDKLTHRPVDDSSDIERPVVRSLAADHPPMLMHSERARVDQNNSRVHMTGKVDIERSAAANSQALTLKSEALTVYPDDDKMETDQPVIMTLGGSTASGTGMKANNATRQVQLQGRGEMHIPPGAAAARGAPAPAPR